MMFIIDVALVEKITHDAQLPEPDDTFAADVKRASAAIGAGVDVPTVAESLSLDMPIEKAHNIARAGELFVQWNEDANESH